MSNLLEKFRAGSTKLAVAGLVGLGSVPAFAALDLTGIESKVTAATTSAETVGGYVIAAVAALIVVGLIISVIRKV
jgi:hypothetical protein